MTSPILSVILILSALGLLIWLRRPRLPARDDRIEIIDASIRRVRAEVADAQRRHAKTYTLRANLSDLMAEKLRLEGSRSTAKGWRRGMSR